MVGFGQDMSILAGYIIRSFLANSYREYVSKQQHTFVVDDELSELGKGVFCKKNPYEKDLWSGS